jgi:imidazole glycerol-phosphate synthase subunit HisH
MIGIINYGLGNVKAFDNVYKKLSIPSRIVSSPDDLIGIDKLILPGVGAFDHAMTMLNNSGLRPMLDEMVIVKKMPVIGICVGLQMLAKSSEEGILPGLGWIDGTVMRFDNTHICVPHMGWNNIKPYMTDGIFKNLDNFSRFYFLHSYYFKCNIDENIISTTDYYGEFASAVRLENIYGVQFHPEKSHEWGVKLLENFANLK